MSGTDKTPKELQDEVKKAQDKMSNNLLKLLERGEKLEALKDLAEDTEQEAKDFRNEAIDLHAKAKFKDYLLSFVVAGIFIGLMASFAFGFGAPMSMLLSAIGGVLGYVGLFVYTGLNSYLSKNNKSNNAKLRAKARSSQDDEKLKSGLSEEDLFLLSANDNSRQYTPVLNSQSELEGVSIEDFELDDLLGDSPSTRKFGPDR